MVFRLYIAAKSVLVLRYYADNAVPTAICEPWGEARKSQERPEEAGRGQERARKGQQESSQRLGEARRRQLQPIYHQLCKSEW